MSTEALQVVKIGIAGIAIGSAVSWGGDMLFSRGIAATGLANPVTMGNLGAVGAAGVQLALAGGFGALVLYGGDQLMQQVSGGADPLFHVLFYNTCYQQSGTIALAARAVRQFMDMGFSSLTTPSTATVSTASADSGLQKQINQSRNRQRDHQRATEATNAERTAAANAMLAAQTGVNIGMNTLTSYSKSSCSKPGGCGTVFR